MRALKAVRRREEQLEEESEWDIRETEHIERKEDEEGEMINEYRVKHMLVGTFNARATQTV
jgi:hypothetical protein